MMYPYLEPKARKIAIENDIRSTNSKIRKIENLYESLRKFKSDVTRSQEDFSGINKRKGDILEPLKTVSDHNNAANRYYKGMKRSLSGIGMNVVGTSFSGLVAMIDAKLRSYKSQLTTADRRLSSLNDSLTETEKEIRAAEAAGIVGGN